MGHAARTNQQQKEQRGGCPGMSNLPGTICVVSGERFTHPYFCTSLVNIKKPFGTGTLWFPAGGGGLAEGRNICVREVLSNPAIKWLWFIDDDHTFARGTLLRLLKHEVDIVVPLVVSRQPPHGHLAFSYFPISAEMTDEELVAAHRASGVRRSFEPNQRGLIEVGHAGTGGMLIGTHVLRAMKDPWFEFRFGAHAGEDTWFCLCARRAGFRVWCDLSTPIGHMTTTALWPKLVDENARVEPTAEFDFSDTRHERLLAGER